MEEDYLEDGPKTFSELVEDYTQRMQWIDGKLLMLDHKLHQLLQLIISGNYKTMTQEQIVERIAMNILIHETDNEPLEDLFKIEAKYNELYNDYIKELDENTK